MRRRRFGRRGFRRGRGRFRRGGRRGRGRGRLLRIGYRM